MSTVLDVVGEHKVINVENGETVLIKSFWQDQDTAIVFFRRWGCILCRLWARELSEIAPLLRKNGVKLVGVGCEELGSKDFLEGKFFDGDLYYVQDACTYNKLDFKRFNVVSIIMSLMWKQSRDAILKGKHMGLWGNFDGAWQQAGGAVLVGGGGTLLRAFKQAGPADHLPNDEILAQFSLGQEYKMLVMENQKFDEQCTIVVSKPWKNTLQSNYLAPIHSIWAERQCADPEWSIGQTRMCYRTVLHDVFPHVCYLIASLLMTFAFYMYFYIN